MSKTDHARRRKTPQQRSEEQLGIADRLLTKLRKKEKELRRDLDVLERELRAQQARRDHLAASPDLKPAAGDTSTTTTGDNA